VPFELTGADPNVWDGYEQYDPETGELPLWEQPIWSWDKMFETGVRAHNTTSRAVVPLMLEAARLLIVNISAGDEGKFLGDVQYDVANAAIDRLGFALARKLKRYGITALTVHPGFTRTERMTASVSQALLAQTHSPRFVRRAIVALVSDPDIMKRTGGAFKAGQLGLDYAFTDVDGSQPAPFSIPEGYGE
jgi:NAD(P)-dependent dehydrogenase (short-subunit alcohol dehydrogenase family)